MTAADESPRAPDNDTGGNDESRNDAGGHHTDAGDTDGRDAPGGATTDAAAAAESPAPARGAQERPDPEPGRASFMVVLPVGVIFILTILAMIAAAFGDPGSPLSAFFDEHGVMIIGLEVGLLVLAAFVAMSVDRVLTQRALREEAAESSVDDMAAAGAPEPSTGESP